MKNRKGHTLVLVVCIVLFSLLAGLKIFMIISQANVNAEPAETQQERREPKETIQQSVDTIEINALLKKAEGYARQADNKHNEAEGNVWNEDGRAFMTQTAIFLELKSIRIQNEVIIKLLREKVDM